jgi:putative transposase
MNCKKLLSIGKTADILGVHIDTLREWDRDEKLVPVKTPGGHRRYRLEDIEAFCGEVAEKKDDEKAVRVVTYSRVSSHEQKQKGDLERQNGRVLAYCVKKKYQVVKRLQQSVSRKVKGSNNRKKATKKVARLHLRISNVRKDVLHKMTTTLAKTKRVVGIEDLNVSGMMKNRCLARSIADLGLFELRRQLSYKGDWYSCKIVPVDRFFPSSKACSVCGEINESLMLADREWTCLCGVHHDRDHNASVNLENVAASLSET